jgi:hypothetical protein
MTNILTTLSSSSSFEIELLQGFWIPAQPGPARLAIRPTRIFLARLEILHWNFVNLSD